MRNDDKEMYRLVNLQRQHRQRFPQEKQQSVEEKYEEEFTMINRLLKKWAPVLEKLPDDET